MTKQKGFTLIELIIVIVILGALAAVAVPRFIDLSDEAQEAALDGVQGAVTSAAAILVAQNAAQGTDPIIPSPTDIIDNVTVASGASVSDEGGCEFEIEVDDGAGSRTFTLDDDLCDEP